MDCTQTQSDIYEVTLCFSDQDKNKNHERFREYFIVILTAFNSC